LTCLNKLAYNLLKGCDYERTSNIAEERKQD
jgi:hypothetical protein